MNKQTSTRIAILLAGIVIGVIGCAVLISSAARYQAKCRLQVAQRLPAELVAESATIVKHRVAKSAPLARGSLLSHKDGSADRSQASARPAAEPAEKKQPEKEKYSWAKPEDVVKEKAEAAASEAGGGGSGQVITTVRRYVVADPPIITQKRYVVPGTRQAVTTTVSGYEIPAGSPTRAVDANLQGGPWSVGNNGLLQNPCVDPPSTRGRAYRTGNSY